LAKSLNGCSAWCRREPPGRPPDAARSGANLQQKRYHGLHGGNDTEETTRRARIRTTGRNAEPEDPWTVGRFAGAAKRRQAVDATLKT